MQCEQGAVGRKPVIRLANTSKPRTRFNEDKMADDMTTAPVADSEPMPNERQKIEADATARGIKFDKRFSDKRLKDMIADHDAKASAPAATAKEPVSDTSLASTEPSLSSIMAELAAMKRENEALKAKIDAPRSNAPPGTLTTMQMTSPGQLGREEDERRALLEQAARLGIARDLRPGLNNDGIRERISAKMAEQAAIQAVVEAQEQRRASKPVEPKVTIRVLPMGDRKISKGIHIPGEGDLKYAYGDMIVDMPLSIAKAHHANGYAEIVAS